VSAGLERPVDAVVALVAEANALRERLPQLNRALIDQGVRTPDGRTLREQREVNERLIAIQQELDRRARAKARR
jgi:hypothetical protein